MNYELFVPDLAYVILLQTINLKKGLEDKSMNSIPEISIVVPMYNEENNVLPLYEKIKDAGDKFKKSYEILFINDGSTDGTEEELRKLKERDPAVRCILFRGNFKKAAAYSAGFQHAKGNIIVTMDGDLQDDPGEMGKFLEKLDEGYDYVSGWKYRGKGNPYRAWPSKIFNIMVKSANKLKIHDFNCPFKAFKKNVIDPNEVYGELYRFLPVMAERKGYRVTEVKIENLPRIHGESKYGIERFLRGFFDFLTVFFLARYTKRPLHFFGGMGILLMVVGIFTIVTLYALKFMFGMLIKNTPFLFGLSIMAVVLGVHLFSIGILGELMTYLLKRPADHYSIKEIL